MHIVAGFVFLKETLTFHRIHNTKAIIKLNDKFSKEATQNED